MDNIRRIDIGINLMNKQFNKDRKAVVEKSLSNGTGLIITGTDLYSSQDAVEFISENNYNNIWCTCGCHPHNAKEYDRNYLDDMIRLIRQNRDKVIAIGECGLDYDRMFSTQEMQRKCFSDLLDTAERLDLPLFLHERKAVDDFIKLMKKHRNLCKRSVVHCFTGDKNTVYRYLQLGMMIGLTGWICDDRRNKDVLEAIKIIPLDRIMIETDAPYLTPLGLGLPKRNTPDNLHYVIEEIAHIKKLPYEAVESVTFENTKRFFNLDI